MNTVFIVLSVLTVISTVIAMADKKAWWIRIFDFPRPQIILVQIISIAGLLLIEENLSLTNGIHAGITLLALGVQITYIFPYFPFAKKEVPDIKSSSVKTISILVANVLMDNRESKTLLKLVAQYQPDIFLAIETNDWWATQLDAIAEQYPHHIKCPMDNTYGMLLYSRFALENGKIEHLVKKSVPSIHADVIAGNFTFKLSCLHPEPPTPEEAETSRPRDRELLLMAHKVKETPGPWVVLGDLNDVAWSDTSIKFLRISNLRDPRKGRGFYNTYDAKKPFMRWALDHVFLSDHFQVSTMKRLPNIGSDHFPIYLKCGVEVLQSSD
ncbi:MAG: endonuclease/exonuclease/phosphatase family protein [Bacteroidales bacterium]|nr:endonuclease/exonuclease/phosphatase family protein [Bacteroidales bacterium]